MLGHSGLRTILPVKRRQVVRARGPDASAVAIDDQRLLWMINMYITNVMAPPTAEPEPHRGQFVLYLSITLTFHPKLFASASFLII